MMKPAKPANKLWTVLSILKWTEEYFKKNKIEFPRLDTELLLAYVLNSSRLELYLNFDKPLRAEELAKYKELIKRRVQHEPVQYITGAAHFLGRAFKVNQNVLIPRFETEILVEKSVELIRNNKFSKIIDLGTGSGVIAISVAKSFPELKILASDISEEALQIANINSKALGVENQIIFKQGNLLEPWQEEIKDNENVLLLANLPYVRENEWAGLAREVKDFEPKQALLSGIEGIDHYQKLFQQLKNVKYKFQLLIETGIQQIPLLEEIAKRELNVQDVKIFLDLNQKERFVLLKKSYFGE